MKTQIDDSASKETLKILNDMTLVEKIAFAACCNDGDDGCDECNERYAAIDNYRLLVIAMISNAEHEGQVVNHETLDMA